MPLFWKRDSTKTIESLREFDKLNKQLESLFTPDSSFLCVDDVEPFYDSYKDYGGNVFARFLQNRNDLRDPEEQKAAEILQDLSDDELGILMFCKFEKFGAMLEQWHKRHEIGYMLSGVMSDNISGAKWGEGEIFHFKPNQLHEPRSLTGCLVLLNFTNNDYL